MNKNSEFARLYEAFSRLSAEQKKEIVKTVEDLAKEQKKDAPKIPQGRLQPQKEKNLTPPD